MPAPEPVEPDARALRDAVSAHARALIAARRAPATDGGGNSTAIAQVAYLMAVEVLIDLEAGKALRAVAIVESLEPDPAEGARSQTFLKPLPPDVAAQAVAIAEHATEFPPIEWGW